MTTNKPFRWGLGSRRGLLGSRCRLSLVVSCRSLRFARLAGCALLGVFLRLVWRPYF